MGLLRALSKNGCTISIFNHFTKAVAGVFLIPLILYSLSFPAYAAENQVSSLRLWKCPKCDMLLQKNLLGQTWNPGDPISKVAGTGTCSKCGSKYPQKDIYGGRYDVLLKATIAKENVNLSTLSMVVFQKVQIATVDEAFRICSKVKNKYYQTADMANYYVISHKDNLSLDEAYIIYTNHLKDGALPNLGDQFDAKKVVTVDGEEAVALFFRKL